MSRKTARRHAFHLIYQFPFHLAGGTSCLAELKAYYYDFIDSKDIDELGILKRPTGRDAKYVERAVWGVYEKQVEIDSVIGQFLKDWTIDRINKVDLALLRLSIYEMLSLEDVPLGVAISEAVDLAKEYGSDDSPAFVNGVLGGVSRAIKAKGRESVGS